LFSVVNAVILRPLPYKDSDRLVVIWKKPVRDANGTKMFDNYQEFENWQRNSKSFEQLAITTWATGGKILTGRGQARTVLALPASINFFQLLGISPALGRTFQNDDLVRGCSVIVRHRFWESVLGGDKNTIGRSLRLDNQDCTVTGVMPAGFTFYPDAASMWMLVTPVSDIVREPDQSAVGVFGRLKAGVSIASAQQEIQTLYRQAHQHEEEGQDLIPMVYPLQEEFAFLTGPNLRLSLLILFGAVNCVLLIACVNVANLMLGRSRQRQRELAVRSALGSGRGRLIRQLLTEALLLSVSGAVLGALLAFAAVHYFRLANPVEMPPGNPVTVNLEVLGFTAALAILTALAFGLAPAWTATKVDLNDVLKAAARGASQGRAGHAFGKALVVAEVTLSVVLLVGGSLLIQTVIRFTAVPLGFSTDHLLTMPVTLPKWHYSQPGQRAKFYERVADNIRNISGVQRVALASSLPLNNGRWAANALTIQGQPEPSSQASVRDVGDASITPEYFEAMHIPLRMGRPFDSRDRDGAEPAAIVNEALVRKYFGHEDPIGKRILVGKPGKDVPWLTIVGVSANEKETTSSKR
jgi:putative ABC transport system permease protein